MKILFYEIKDFEFNYLLDKIPNTIEPAFLRHSLTSDTFVDEKQKDSEAICCFVSSELTKEVLEQFHNLKYVFLRCMGFSNVDLNYCKEKNIKVFNAPNYGNSTVAEYVFMLILSLIKKTNKTTSDLKKGIVDADDIMGIELCRKTIGIIGAGNIGRKVINIAQGFNMEVLVCDINKQGAYNFVELDELLSKSDFVTLNCPLTDKTRNLINKYTLSLMKPNSFLINVSRGETVNTKDLYMALVNKKIKGAGLDVIECEETLCNSKEKCQNFDNLKNYCLKKYFFIQKLMQLDNVIITPHNAYNTVEANTRILNITLNNIISCCDKDFCLKNQVILN